MFIVDFRKVQWSHLLSYSDAQDADLNYGRTMGPPISPSTYELHPARSARIAYLYGKLYMYLSCNRGDGGRGDIGFMTRPVSMLFSLSQSLPVSPGVP